MLREGVQLDVLGEVKDRAGRLVIGATTVANWPFVITTRGREWTTDDARERRNLVGVVGGAAASLVGLAGTLVLLNLPMLS